MFGCLMLWIIFSPHLAQAVEVNPDPQAVANAIQDGKAHASQPANETTNTIGTPLCEGYGFLQTKLWNIREESKHNEKKMRPLKQERIESILNYPTMLITFMYCSSDHRKTDDHLVMKQGDTVIQPEKVSVDLPEHLSNSQYIHTIQAHFAYGAFNPKAETTVIAIPENGKRIEYAINLEQYR